MLIRCVIGKTCHDSQRMMLPRNPAYNRHDPLSMNPCGRGISGCPARGSEPATIAPMESDFDDRAGAK